MIQLTDIHSLSDFQRNAKNHLKQMKKTGRPRVLTINGKAELIVQDAKSYQNCLLLSNGSKRFRASSADWNRCSVGKAALLRARWKTCARNTKFL